MDFILEIMGFLPENEQEINDRKIIIDFINRFGDNVLLRENEIAHITCSAFVMNEKFNKILMARHNIMDSWAWPGGHADGAHDMLTLTQKEVFEETGLKRLNLLSKKIASLDIMPVAGHRKNGKFISSHLHLNASYLFTADEKAVLRHAPGENSSVKWIPVKDVTRQSFSAYDCYLYSKLIEKTKHLSADL